MADAARCGARCSPPTSSMHRRCIGDSARFLDPIYSDLPRCSSPATWPSSLPYLRPCPPGAAAAAGGPPAAPAAVPAACPEGTSPEEFEAYRRKCWEQYFEYTAACQKYYPRGRPPLGQGAGQGPRAPPAAAELRGAWPRGDVRRRPRGAPPAGAGRGGAEPLRRASVDGSGHRGAARAGEGQAVAPRSARGPTEEDAMVEPDRDG
ncbi:unnamed protein product [Prorocentrum cordatum]|uniref:Uncharacterized protein n=1 Tax=Prorocentrum cordatum TaxID=2364126 RepID=A0ABN9RBW6_9DINO|nr:unnamed protein product [Polarella glacialis]